ncbi:MAG TPA: response regulator [Caldilineae bacterium]|nr:response regulator [Caldilineae bacterium]
MAERTWRILYVEDQPEMIDLIRLALRHRPVEVMEANSAKEALELMRTRRPDLVLLDLMMPEVDGWAVHREMMADPQLKDVPIIIITARGSLEEREKGLRTPGVVDYFIKPFAPSQLIASIDRVLDRLSRKTKTPQQSQD